MRSCALVALGWVLASGLVGAETPRGYFRFPAIHGSTVVFTAEGDLWKVSSAGGSAERLTSHPGQETSAAISPDGKWLAFSGQYEGPTEVYVMPVAGGQPKRLTFESGNAQVRGWTPDGKILYSTKHFSTLPDAQLVAIDPQTSARTFVPLAQADEGAYDDSGKTLIFTRLAFQGSQTKRYEGGTAENLWKFDGAGGEAIPLTADYAGTSRWPMWYQGRIYFASDRDGNMNLWSMKPDGSGLRQHTHHNDFGIKNPSLDGGHIVYQNGADLWIYDLASDQTKLLPITLTSDFDQLREHWVKKPLDALTGAELSPDGNRVVMTIRGQVFVVPAKDGRLVAATHTPGVRYQNAVFFPDGKSLLALSDASRETEFTRLPANGVGTPEALSHDANDSRLKAVISPDGKSIVYAQKDSTLWLRDVASGQAHQIDRSTSYSFDPLQLVWSKDSRWLAYLNNTPNLNQVLVLYNVASGQSTIVTSDRINSSNPAFSPDGKWLYFVSDRTFNSVVHAPWGSYQPEPFFEKQTKIYQLALQANERSPFEPEDELSADEAKAKGDSKSEKSEKSVKNDKKEKKAKDAATANAAAGEKSDEKEEDKDKEKDKDKDKPAEVVIDLNGIQSRLWEVPVPAGRYGDLHVTDKALYFTDASLPDDGGETHLKVDALEITSHEPEISVIRSDVKTFTLSADGKKMLLREKDSFYVLDAGTSAVASVAKDKVDLDALKVSYLPTDDWKQMFADAWRMHRDYFYDKGMHGVDWKAAYQKYLPLADRATDLAELDDTIAYLVSELSALHTFVDDQQGRRGSDEIKVASLGAVWSRDEANGGYRIVHIYQADPDFPATLSPLQKPGVGLGEGDVIQTINGVDLLSIADPEMLLRNQAGLQVLVRGKAAKDGATFNRILVPIDQRAARDLRYTDWELERRHRVEKAAPNAIGYVHLRAMGGEDYNQWAREYYPVNNRPGLILDLRHNQGGNIDSWIMSRLMRKDWMWWSQRDGVPFSNFQFPAPPHIAVLVDGSTSSDGETMANGVRHLHLGKLFGTRTWGGGIWLSFDNLLVDGGIASAAEAGSFIRDEGWVVEGRGITPDVVVDNLPAATYRGEDKQLEAAIEYLKAEIAKDPHPMPTPPTYPVKTH